MKKYFYLLPFLGLSSFLFSQSVIKSRKLSFRENLGQVTDQNYQSRSDVLFYGRTSQFNYYLRNNGVSYQLSTPKSSNVSSDLQTDDPFFDNLPDTFNTYRVDINWIMPNKNAILEQGKVVDGHDNFYLAHTPEGIMGVKSYETITYKNLYDGIDLKWYEYEGALEYDYIIAPGGDYKQIKWSIDGAEEIYIDENGLLVILTPLGQIKEQKPVAYQNNSIIEVKWSIEGNSVGFNLESYDLSQPLIIDPVIRVWGSYYGGLDDDNALVCLLSNSNNIYIAGQALSLSNIATSGSYQNTLGGLKDSYLAKFNTDGERLWATYYGGIENDFLLNGAIDPSENIYINGRTFSPSGIASPGAHQAVFGGNNDGFLVKFNLNGERLWATYYGGEGLDDVYACGIDNSSNIYLTGGTTSKTGISTAGANQMKYPGEGDAFLAKFNSDGIRLWGTYMGGERTEWGYDLAIDNQSNIYIVGETNSETSIATAGAHQPTYAKSSSSWLPDAFLVKFNENGTKLWGTYYGGRQREIRFNCAVGPDLMVYICGTTRSDSNIASTGSYRDYLLGPVYQDGYLAKFDPSGVRQWATYIGGELQENTHGLSTDQYSNVYIAGTSVSPSGIATWGNHQVDYSDGSDGFLISINPDGLLRWGTYYGGVGYDIAYDCAVSDAMDVYMAGTTNSSDSISTSGSYQSSLQGVRNGFLVKFNYVVGLNESTQESHTVHVYPNPTTGAITLEWNETYTAVNLQIFNTQGKMILSKDVYNSNHTNLNINEASGIYLLKVVAGDKILRSRIIKL